KCPSAWCGERSGQFPSLCSSARKLHFEFSGIPAPFWESEASSTVLSPRGMILIRRGKTMVRQSGDALIEGTTVRETWVQWPIFWSAVWTGTLAALATALVIGLIGIAVGAHQLTGLESRIYELKKIGFLALFFSVFGSFLAFVVGGWVAGKVAGILRS